jgi:hypothetical protein
MLEALPSRMPMTTNQPKPKHLVFTTPGVWESQP